MRFATEVRLILFGILQIYPHIIHSQTLARNAACTANGGVPGRCTPLEICHAALGYLRSNVTLPACDANNPRLVCCPSGKRVSAMMCEKYKNVLKKTTSVIPLLPIFFVPNDAEPEIVCDPNLNPLISDGRDAQVNEMPFMVAVGYNVSNVPWRCGGTLISEDKVLTAAHCVVNQYA
ncbi:Chymotrypsin-C [Orchesella cincta]|uniref:Chymotrypsin-C n=1 Tax=Orchesella cincta TaxID=48709 RepID=A0A1D2N700_ORCCI|nr:Chymotrypsin-C [Orchesella cincta]